MPLSRRTFLGFSCAAAVTWSVGESVPAATGTPDDVARLFAVRPHSAAAARTAAAAIFPLSVGSGDPAPDGIVLWKLKLINLYLPALFPTLPNLEVFLNLDQWDGFPAERTMIFNAVKGVDNFVAIAGDLHSFGAGYLRPNFGNPPRQPVGISLLGGSVTSSNFVEQRSFGVGGRLVPPEAELTWALRGGNPHLRYFNSAAHDYVIMEADHFGMRCTMKAVRTVRTTEADLLTLRVFGVPEGQVRLTTLETGTREFGNVAR